VDAAPPIHPAFRVAAPPILVVGMHRSGTSLVSGLLVQLGVFMGPDARLPAFSRGTHDLDADLVRSGYGETLPFRLVNDRVLARAGAAWDRPDNYLTARPAGADLMRAATFGGLYRNFGRFLPDGPWGWKDPRTTLTLSAWLQVFPDAQVVHVRRDPEAAARSLHRRAITWQAAAAAAGPLPPLRRAAWWATHPVETLRRAARRFGLAAPAAGDPCTDLDHCRRLAERYTAAACEARDAAAHWLAVDYEALLADPVGQVRRLTACLELRPAPEQILQAAWLIRR